MKAAFAEQARAIAAAGADGIVVETMSDPAEAALAVAAAHETGLPVVACMTFGAGAKQDRTMMGTTPEQAAEQLAAAGADVIGSNCGQGIAGMVEICRRLHAATDRPVWIKANAGLPEIVDGQTCLPSNARRVRRLRAATARRRRDVSRRLLRHDARVHPGGGGKVNGRTGGGGTCARLAVRPRDPSPHQGVGRQGQ